MERKVVQPASVRGRWRGLAGRVATERPRPPSPAPPVVRRRRAQPAAPGSTPEPCGVLGVSSRLTIAHMHALDKGAPLRYTPGMNEKAPRELTSGAVARPELEARHDRY